MVTVPDESSTVILSSTIQAPTIAISRQVRNETLENEKACSVVRQVLA
jgi:hypothetical protein